MRDSKIPPSQFPDFAPDWVRFREAMDLNRQISVHSDYAIRQVRMLHKVASDNYRKKEES